MSLGARFQQFLRGELSLWREHVSSFAWAAILALLIRTFIMAPFKIPSGSMQPTLMIGDRILVNKFLYRFHEPQRGNIVVFRYPNDPQRPFIKRLIGVGGDQVTIQDHRVVVNGSILEQPDVFRHIMYENQGLYGQLGQVVSIPTGAFFVLGDNSGSSHDSRYWGFVPRKLLIGRAMCIFWPPNRIRVLR